MRVIDTAWWPVVKELAWWGFWGMMILYGYRVWKGND